MIDRFPKVWVLIDQRSGNASQAIGVAEAFKLPYIEKKIKFNLFSMLPNLIKSKNFLNININQSDDILSSQPDILISAGRKLASVSRYLKNLYPNIFNINCMHPNFDMQDFNLNILPKHDSVAETKNTIEVLGAVNKVNKYFMFNEGLRWEQKFSHLKKKKISLFLGGGTRSSQYKITHLKKLLSLANELAIKENASLLITTSRRSDFNIKSLINTHIGCSNYFYEYSKLNENENPCNGFLALADLHIVTGDSIAMCSEAVSTGRPCFIFVADEVLQFKHKFFIQELFKNNYALAFNNQLLTMKIDEIKNNCLQEGERISSTLISEYQKFVAKMSLINQ